MKEKFICSICKSEHTDLTSYMNCVTTCCERVKKENAEAEAKKRAEEVNAALNGIKQAKAYWEQKIEEFKEKYPEEYEMNFGTRCYCKNNLDDEHYWDEGDEDWWLPESTKPSKPSKPYKSVEVSVKSDGKGEPVVNATINGKKAGNEEVDKYLNKLLEDPETNWIAKMLGLV